VIGGGPMGLAIAYQLALEGCRPVLLEADDRLGGMAASFEPILLYGQLPWGELCRLALMGNHERMSAARAHQVGFVQDVVPLSELRATAGRIAHAIASQPAAAVEGTLRSLWAARQMARAQALAMAPHLVTLGNTPEAMAEGQAMFASGRRITPEVR
jgi:enoyl-CoA hydratase/carnithine racemase